MNTLGLINWFKNKVILSLEHDVEMLKVRCDGLDMQIQGLKSQINSVRTMKRRKVEESGEDEDSDFSEVEKIRQAFGGDIPIELVEKYNKQRLLKN